MKSYRPVATGPQATRKRPQSDTHLDQVDHDKDTVGEEDTEDDGDTVREEGTVPNTSQQEATQAR